MNRVYTIGYASYSLPEFIAVLMKFGINAVADVRTTPYSHFKPDFNSGFLAEKLTSRGISYLSLGNECGARPDDRSCYVNNRVNFDILSSTGLFRQGLQRLKKAMEQKCLAIMCAEQDPIRCHRYLLVARELSNLCPGLELINILRDGKTETVKETESRLLKEYDLDADEIPGIGKSFSERLQEAVAMQREKISYHNDNQEE